MSSSANRSTARMAVVRASHQKAYKVHCGVNVQLLHDTGAMVLDRAHAQMQLLGDCLAGLTRNDEAADGFFPLSQQSKPGLNGGRMPFFQVQLPCLGQGELNLVKHQLSPKRFLNEIDGAIANSLDSRPDLGVTADKQDRCGRAAIDERTLQLKTTHPLQSEINDKAVTVGPRAGGKEFISTGIGVDGDAHGAYQGSKEGQNVWIVVDNAYGARNLGSAGLGVVQR